MAAQPRAMSGPSKSRKRKRARWGHRGGVLVLSGQASLIDSIERALFLSGAITVRAESGPAVRLLVDSGLIALAGDFRRNRHAVCALRLRARSHSARTILSKRSLKLRSLREVTGKGGVCLTCSFQAEDVLLTKLAIEFDPAHSDSFSRYRLSLRRDLRVSRPHCARMGPESDQSAAGEDSGRAGGGVRVALSDRARPAAASLRKVEPLFKAVAGYRVWLTGCAASRPKAAPRLKSRRCFHLPGGKQVLKLAPLAEWTTRDVWYACEQLRDSALAALRARLFLHRLRAMYHAAPRSQRSAIRPLGRTQGGMRHTH
jgi:hypothetical protein